MNTERTRVEEYSAPALAEEKFIAEIGFCSSKQFEDFGENKIYWETFE